jgi:ubiquinone/menaquinone biosynthesis C-methylase UbiE
MPYHKAALQRDMADRDLESNRQIYERQDIAAHYAAMEYLTPCEHLLFESYIPQGSAILDLGVGGGRTTAYLAPRASRYVGIDYAASMVAASRAKFPGLEFLVADAADLSIFSNSSFDAVVFSFNGIDNLSEDGRRRCLEHVCRILKPGGFFIFSTHNPRLLMVRPRLNRERAKRKAQCYSLSSKALYWPLYASLIGVETVLACGRTLLRSMEQIFRRVPSRCFWRGEGTLVDSVLGGIVTHYATPQRVLDEVSPFGLRPVKILGDDYPHSSRLYLTGWYYYVFTKPKL